MTTTRTSDTRAAPARRSGRSAERVAEVLDALARRQREVPRWLVAEAHAADEAAGSARGAHAAAERALIAASLARLLEPPAPRAVVAVGAATPDVGAPLLEALLARGTVERVVVADVAGRPARRAADAVAALRGDVAVTAVATDPALDLALPAGLPHPRAYLCLGNALGACGTVGAVRLLRVVRAAMGALDRLVLGLDLRHDRGALEDEGRDAAGLLAERHLAVLDALNHEIGADFERARFACRVAYEAEARRVDTHLVAQRAMRVSLANGATLALRKGESIRTGVDCRFDRGRIGAMLDGVGLRVDAWLPDAVGRAAVAVVVPAA